MKNDISIKKVLVVGGAGYVGSRLVPVLLKEGCEVVVLDLYIYGEVFKDLKDRKKLTEIKEDVRNLEKIEKAVIGCDAVIHLACISNDPSFELDPTLGKSINLDSFEPFVKLCKKHKIKRFIYASSSSVYGIKKEKNVTEDMELLPITDYSKYKKECEKILFKYKSEDFTCSILRPATVCGYAKRQRFDLVVNILSNFAYNKGKIKVTGGNQMRPNIHINDMVRAYLLFLKAPKEKIQGEIFNVGYQNLKVLEIAKTIKNIMQTKKDVDIEIFKTNDNRSYHISSEKIEKKLGFFPKNTIEDAIKELLDAFENKKFLNPLENEMYFNIKRMQKIKLK